MLRDKTLVQENPVSVATFLTILLVLQGCGSPVFPLSVMQVETFIGNLCNRGEALSSRLGEDSTDYSNT